MAQNNYVLGRGEVSFARLNPDGTLGAFRYIGNTPELSFNIESEELEHFSSDRGIREKDDSVPLEVNRSGTVTTDNIQRDNVALFFFGEATTITQAVVASAPETFNDVPVGGVLKLGVSVSNPAGYLGIDTTGFTVTSAGTPMVSGTDFEMDFDMGILTLLDTSAVHDAVADVVVTYAVRGHTRDRVISGSTPVEGALLYREYNPKGKNHVWYMPKIKVTPSGDYNLKGDDWQTLPMALEILKPDNAEAIYRDGAPMYA